MLSYNTLHVYLLQLELSDSLLPSNSSSTKKVQKTRLKVHACDEVSKEDDCLECSVVQVLLKTVKSPSMVNALRLLPLRGTRTYFQLYPKFEALLIWVKSCKTGRSLGARLWLSMVLCQVYYRCKELKARLFSVFTPHFSFQGGGGVIVDDLHCLYLGVASHLIELWFDKKYRDKDHYIGQKVQCTTNCLLMMLCNLRPKLCA